MNKFILTILIFITTGCGIDKEAPPALPSVANSGELDANFFGNGILTLNNSALGNDNDEIYDIAIDSQNRVIAVGRSINGSSNYDLAVWRLTANGLLDTSFDGDGIFIHDNAAGGSGNDSGYAVYIGPSDEIYVTGTSLNGSGDFDMTVWKLNSSGALDTSFNGTGIFTHDMAGFYDQGNDLALDSTGALIVAGYTDQTLTNRDMTLWKLTSAGILDTSFDSDGHFISDGVSGGIDDVAHALKIDILDNIYAVGRSESVANSSDMTIWKVTSSGSLDTSFNGTGVFTHDGAAGSSNFDAANDIVFDASGALLVTGYSRNINGNNDMVIWKVSNTGSLDTSFDNDGIVTFDVSTIFGGATNDVGESILIDSEGKIIVAGNGNSDMCVWRFNADGSLDTDFNTDGFFSNDSAAGGFGVDTATSLSLDSLNRLYIGGYSDNNSGDIDATFWRMK